MCGGRRSPAPVQQAPSTNDAEVREAVEREKELARRRRGRRSTILTGPQGVQDNQGGNKTLLGQ